MVCSFSVDKEGDTIGKCADWNDVSDGLGELDKQEKIKKLHANNTNI